MAKAAAWPDLRGKARPDKPWLDGMPRLIFVGDIGDIFSKDVPFDYLASELIETAQSKAGRRHQWLVLTKQPQQLGEFAAWLGPRRWPENIWAGVSVTSRTTLQRAGMLLSVPGPRVRFVSAEPLLAPVDFNERELLCRDWNLGRLTMDRYLDWVIVGGESGPKSRPCDLAWIRSIVRQCGESATACFVKQMRANVFDGDHRISIKGPGSHDVAIDFADRKGGDWSVWPADLRVRQMPGIGGAA